MNTPDENQDTTIQTSTYNPFPEPQTIPSGWDTSTFFVYPQPASSEQVDDLPEQESE